MRARRFPFRRPPADASPPIPATASDGAVLNRQSQPPNRDEPVNSRHSLVGQRKPVNPGHRLSASRAHPPISTRIPVRTRRFLPVRTKQGMKLTGMYWFRGSRDNVRPRYTRWGAFILSLDNANPQISTAPPHPMDEICGSAPIWRSESSGLHELRQGPGRNRRVCTSCTLALAGIGGFARAGAKRWMG